MLVRRSLYLASKRTNHLSSHHRRPWLDEESRPIRDSAKAAIIAIHEALTDNRDVKVFTAKGCNVTNMGFYKEQFDDGGQGKIDDIIIETTKVQGEARRQAMPKDYGDCEVAVLITEDCNMHVKANSQVITASQHQISTESSPRISNRNIKPEFSKVRTTGRYTNRKVGYGLSKS
ncbi:hypothetical protein L873DRAFT_1466350 [Choiromyces venosus 120613-1]|uniref:PIN domain-containing protein n=1 Tax=Choiromyces venosus 120613-1 TaxID=1336337 RepID=A0A3N4K4Q6_9PEZI|nr:hypothetical protein L873DRAFT_1466350 [Choiromyces venosus 120613-1]